MFDYIKKKAENKFHKLENFYNKFEVPLPSLELILYRKFPRNKWIDYLTIHIIDFSFLIFWLFSLYYISNIGNNCNLNLSYFVAQMNNNCSDYTCTNMNASNFNISINKLVGIVK